MVCCMRENLKAAIEFKHQNNDKRLHYNDNKGEKGEKGEKTIICECGKKYLYSQGLSKHKKKCNNYEKKNEEKNSSP